MIEIKFKNPSKPMLCLKEFYDYAVKNGEKFPEACAISSSDRCNNVDSRFINIKYILDDELIFFSNYKSPKAKQFESCSKISALFFWNTINVQIRIKAKIAKTNSKFSDLHFMDREESKNILAIISDQSKEISSYEDIVDKYNNFNNTQLIKRPEYWGGYSFKPYYFEFWEGHENRINKREAFILNKSSWENFFLQP